MKKMKEYEFEDEYVIEYDPLEGKMFDIIAKSDKKIE